MLASAYMWNLFSNNKNEKPKSAGRIRKEVEKKKKKAEKMGIPKLISDLYHHNIRYYPSWIGHSREYVPTMIERAHERKHRNNKEEVEILLNKKVYLFKYEEDDIEENVYGNLKLFINGEKGFAISESVFHDKEKSYYNPIAVDAFGEGEWINDFQQLDKQIKVLAQKRKKDEFQDSAEISKLRKDFDI